MRESLASATDLTAWRKEIEGALGPLLDRFEDTFGYPPGDNRIDGTSSGDVGQEDLPPPLAGFYQVIGEVSLPDIGNGHFVHTAENVLGQLREQGAVRVTGDVEGIVFASNGGGLLYAIAATGTIHRSRTASRDTDFELVATDLAAYLGQLKAVVIGFAQTGEPGRL